MNLNAYSFYTNEFKPVTVFIQMNLNRLQVLYN